MISEEAKKVIKNDFYRINAEKLKEAAKNDPRAKEMLKYYNRVKAGKARYSQAIKINGKIVGKVFQDQIKRDAKKAGFTLSEYWKRNKKVIAEFYINSFIVKKKKAIEAVKIAEELSTKNYTLSINNKKTDLVTFVAVLTEQDAKIIREMNGAFVLWILQISEANRQLNINIDKRKIAATISNYKKSLRKHRKQNG